MNPFQAMDNLYSLDSMEKYRSAPIGALPAHVFGVGEIQTIF